MKTLDEVIEILERQIDKTRIKILDKDLLDSVPDALYYLKAYKEMVDSFTGIVVQYKEFFKMIIDEAENENVG